MIYMQFMGRGLGYLEVPVLAVEDLKPEHLDPMCWSLAKEKGWYENRARILINTGWIMVDRTSLKEA